MITTAMHNPGLTARDISPSPASTQDFLPERQGIYPIKTREYSLHYDALCNTHKLHLINKCILTIAHGYFKAIFTSKYQQLRNLNYTKE